MILRSGQRADRHLLGRGAVVALGLVTALQGLEEMRERIGLLQSLARKYGGRTGAAAESDYGAGLEKAKAYLEKAKNELTGIELSSGEEARSRALGLDRPLSSASTGAAASG